ncbi:uncharacterized protein [Periplaneta americana]|uniref:uncharacterized protein n=1 Tax=Periplaneta americana TaxID=6978 RepID=UPI0037E851FE
MLPVLLDIDSCSMNFLKRRPPMQPAMRILIIFVVVTAPTFMFWLCLMYYPVKLISSYPEDCWSNLLISHVVCDINSLEKFPEKLKPGIEELGFKGNMSILRENYFLSRNITEIKTLNVSRCSLLSIEIGAFNGLIKLTQLIINNNMVRELKSGTFQELKILKKLELENNGISEIELGTFAGLTSLNYLSLVGNNITKFSNYLFLGFRIPNQGRIKSSLASHLLNTLPSELPGLQHSNELRKVNVHIQANMTRLSYLYLHGNPLICDCRLVEFWQWSKNNSIMIEKENKLPECIYEEKVVPLSAMNGCKCEKGNDITLKNCNISPLLKFHRKGIHNTNLQNLKTYVQPVVYAILFLFGVTLNVTLVTIIVTVKEMHTLPNMYILNMAISDLASLLSLPIVHIDFVFNLSNVGRFFCSLLPLCRRLVTGVSAYSVCVLSMQRYYVIVLPLQSARPTWKVTRRVILAVWLLASVIGIPSVFAFQADFDNNCTPYVNLGFYQKVIILDLVSCCILPLCVVACMHIMAARHLVKAGVVVSESAAESRRKSARIVLGLSLVFLVSYGPYHVIDTIIVFHPDKMSLWYYEFVCSCLLVLNSCFSPVALYLSSTAFRNEFKRRLFRCKTLSSS